MSTVGVDCGLNGAMAFYDHASGYMAIEDMPTYRVTVNKTKRQRVDDVALLTYFEMAVLKGADRVVIEQQWDRPGQTGMFAMGQVFGMIRMACVANKLPIEEVPPQTWKHILKVPGGKDADDEMIMKRADDMMPHCRGLWRGPRGGRLLDRAEAAMIAYFGETFKVRID